MIIGYYNNKYKVGSLIFLRAGFRRIFNIRIKFFDTIRADTVTEFRFRMLFDIQLDLFPVSLIIPYLFTGCTDRQEYPEQINFV